MWESHRSTAYYQLNPCYSGSKCCALLREDWDRARMGLGWSDILHAQRQLACHSVILVLTKQLGLQQLWVSSLCNR